MTRVPLVLGMLTALIVSPAIAEGEKLPALIQASQPSDYFLAARFPGRLYLDDAGCIRVARRNGDPGPFVIWSHGSRIERTPDGRIRIMDGYNGKIVHIGEEVVVGGGVTTKVPIQGLTEPVPEACASGTFLFTAILTEVVVASPEPSRFGSHTKPKDARPAGLPEDYVPVIPAHELEPDTGPLSAALQERFRDRIAGIYIEREPGFHVVVRLTGNRDAATLQYQLGETRVRVEVQTGAPHTVEELRAAFEQRETITRVLPHGYGGYVDERTGDVVLTVEIGNEPAVGTEAALSEALGVPVRIIAEERAIPGPRRQQTEERKPAVSP